MSGKRRKEKRKSPELALLLGWLAPGAGHYYAGKRDKALLFALIICTTFLFGLALTKKRGVFFFESNPAAGGIGRIMNLKNLRMAAQLLNGLPAVAAVVGARMAGIANDPADLPEHYTIGLYTIWIAGLLNLLVALDACVEAAGLKGPAPPPDESAPGQGERADGARASGDGHATGNADRRAGIRDVPQEGGQ